MDVPSATFDPRALSLRLSRSTTLPTLAVLISGVVFLIESPYVGDMWAAVARAGGAKVGVGLNYWFNWYAGASAPGSYSLLTPLLSAVIGARLLLVIATVALVPLAALASRGLPQQRLAIWVCAAVGSLNLWAGRVPYTLGALVGVAAIVAVRAHRPVVASLLGAVTVAFSPLAGCFLGIALAAVVLVDKGRRTTALICGGIMLTALLGLSLWFGTPGPQGFSAASAIFGATLLISLLSLRPAKPVAATLWITLAVLPLLAIVPNGIAANIMRLIYTALPVAVAATATVRSKPRLVLGLVPALACCLGATIIDLHTADAPISKPDAYTALRSELTQLPDLTNRRLEVARDGSHAAAAMLVNTAALARGYETQTENDVDAVLISNSLTATTYRQWLDANAVGYVAAARTPVAQTNEWRLVTSGQLPYLTKVWSDRYFDLYRVQDATTIVPAPAQLLSADQASMTIYIPHEMRLTLRLRYSHLLTARSEPAPKSADFDETPDGWTSFHAKQPGVYQIGG
jgi:hypothetical protein